MTKELLFWILMLFWLVFGIWDGWSTRDGSKGPAFVRPVGTVLLFILIGLLGWRVFGEPIK